MIKGILFDLDGVLCDLVKAHERAFKQAVFETTSYCFNAYECNHYYNGLPTTVKLRILISRGILEERDEKKVWVKKQELTSNYLSENLFFDKEKVEMLIWLKEQKYKIGCVSNAIYKTIETALFLTGQIGYMDLILGNEEFGKFPKPDPHGYNKAMNILGLRPKQVLIIEDSPKGVLAAKRSMAFVKEVANPFEVTVDNIRKWILDYDKI